MGRGGGGAREARSGSRGRWGKGDAGQRGTAEGRRCRVHDNRVTLRAGARN